MLGSSQCPGQIALETCSAATRARMYRTGLVSEGPTERSEGWPGLEVVVQEEMRAEVEMSVYRTRLVG